MIIVKDDRREKVLLVGCQLDENDEQFYNSIDELKSLTHTARGEVVGVITQKREKVEPSTYIGKGKVQEITEKATEAEIDVVIFNDELNPSQIRNLSEAIQVRIIDRTQLILDIFATRAKTKEGKFQVELAQLEYLLPRLTGKGNSLSRLGGGIGTRGPGETKLENERRYIRKRINDIEEQLHTIVEHRNRYRKRRKKNNTYQVALIGYTNAGKSTLFNKLTKEETFEEDLLFATLDPLTRKMYLPCGLNVLLTDTVGFIENLPTTLVAAFRSTIEEVKEADLILHVVDSSNINNYRHEETVYKLLKELEAEKIPILTLYNKQDEMHAEFLPSGKNQFLYISAFEEHDITEIKEKVQHMMMDQVLEPYEVVLPSTEGRLLSHLKAKTIIKDLHYDETDETFKCSGFIHPTDHLKVELQGF